MSQPATVSGDRWAQVLSSGLAARSLRLTAAVPPQRFSWAVFSRGPVRLAYPRFPIGLVHDDAGVMSALPATLEALRNHGVDLVRLSASVDMVPIGNLPLPEVQLPETTIRDLQGWSERDLPRSTRHKMRKADRQGVRVQSAGPGDGALLYELYIATLYRHRGTKRYTLEYFKALCEASCSSEDVSIGKVLAANGEIAGFIVMLHDGDCSYYLHGGYSDRYSRLRPGYVAMAWAIGRCQALGVREFNMLVSPSDQPALRKYKEEFGGETQLRSYWTVPLTLTGKAAAVLLRVAAIPRRLRRVREGRDA